MGSDEERVAAKKARADAIAERIALIETGSPWWTLRESAAYEKRPPRWLAEQAKAGRVRCARVGGKGQLFFRREWLDQHIEDLATPIMVLARRRA